MLEHLFTRNSTIHPYKIRQMNHYHVPFSRTELGKRSLRFKGALLRNKILCLDINPKVSEFIFARNMKAAIFEKIL